ncbi:alpha/beta fold hydrolase [Marinomonas mediterranea]|uniref:Alpha/beta hydrolase n=1 Tax=Marinomonas mediterranea (strain ATCC 700492 / JCM 21426 / NBRC 103028 / MMB-1) TaxID=717774 RepID=F2K2B7_MARM1|nr:alpha/beta hydrolase [Marinomonas mediterranea]ADZ92297.1 alpha/beta hydrolase [Marinomonas mediterranea MMB-1]WCN18348.1 alpha/beta fold hydrolase [Marinomonas mediterranea MMB-1]
MSEINYLNLENVTLRYRLVYNPDSKTKASCLMLHGAGVGADITYLPILEHLNYWRWILLPDLTGMGESYFLEKKEKPVSIDSLALEINALLMSLEWDVFDLVGYSLGGLVGLRLNQLRKEQRKVPSKMALLEPASLDREDLATLAIVRERYREASTVIRKTGDVEQGVALFMNSVAPNRRKHPVAEATTQSRLAHRPHGFAYALDAVTNWVQDMVNNPDARNELIECVDSALLLSGALSNEALRSHYDALASRYPNWRHSVLSGCDHSLPFQKPKRVAMLLTDWFESELDSGE